MINNISLNDLLAAIDAGKVDLPEGVTAQAAREALHAGIQAGLGTVGELASDGSPVGAALALTEFVRARNNAAYDADADADAEDADEDVDGNDDEDDADDEDEDEDADDEDDDVVDGEFLRQSLVRIEGSVDGISSSIVSTFSISLTVGVASLLCVTAALMGVWRDVRAMHHVLASPPTVVFESCQGL